MHSRRRSFDFGFGSVFFFFFFFKLNFQLWGNIIESCCAFIPLNRGLMQKQYKGSKSLHREIYFRVYHSYNFG